MRIGCMTAAAVVVAALASGCNAPAGTRYAEDMCSGTTYSGCVAGVAAAVGAGWKLFAICEYANGEGDVVQLDTAGEADDRCSAGGTIAPSTVFAVVNR
jgi:hypothetical protein